MHLHSRFRSIALRTSAMLCSLSVGMSALFNPISISAKAGEDFRYWKQSDQEFNQEPAWPKSLTGNKDYYLRQFGCLVTSIAMQLRNYNVIDSSDTGFNPFTASRTMLNAGLFDRLCYLDTQNIAKAFPRFEFAGSYAYTPEKTSKLFNEGYALIAAVKNFGHYIAIADASIKDEITIFDPDSTYTKLSDWGTVNRIYAFRVKDGRMPDRSPRGQIDAIRVNESHIEIDGWAVELDLASRNRENAAVNQNVSNDDPDTLSSAASNPSSYTAAQSYKPALPSKPQDPSDLLQLQSDISQKKETVPTLTLYLDGKAAQTFKPDLSRPDIHIDYGTDTIGFRFAGDLDPSFNGWKNAKIVISNAGWQGSLFDQTIWEDRIYVGPDLEAPVIHEVSASKNGPVVNISASATDDKELQSMAFYAWQDNRTLDEITDSELLISAMKPEDGKISTPITPTSAGTWKFAAAARDAKGNISRRMIATIEFTEEDDRHEVYRLYNPNSGEHFYTPSAHERDSLIKAGWKDEGIGWLSAGFDGDPVYRVYNPNAGDHHYTMNIQERNHLVSLGWKNEGIGWLSCKSHDVTILRQYNPNAASGSHNYTSDENEHNYLGTVGWQLEGTAWYACKPKDNSGNSKPEEPDQPDNPDDSFSSEDSGTREADFK